MKIGKLFFVLAIPTLIDMPWSCAQDVHGEKLFARENLVAWCIVPFDASKRTPAQRATMVSGLGIRRVAYDWRAEHVPQFEEEIRQYQKHGLQFFAFWSWHDSLEPLISQYGIRPQIWIMMRQPTGETQELKVQHSVQSLLPLVRKTRSLGCKLGIYNHGGWSGEPANMVAVARELQEHHDADHVGIVYNFHHGHDHIHDFSDQLDLMKSYLHCININGMTDAATVKAGRDKILSLGKGQHEKSMLIEIRDSGYSGPIGILDHRKELDAEESLKQNLNGLSELVEQLE